MTEKIPPANGKKSDAFTLSDFNSRTQLTEKDELQNEYNPFEHRPTEHSNSTAGSLAHLLKSSLGTGILAMPMAFKNAGLLFGAIGTIIIGIICTHCVHILVKTSHNICRITKSPSLGFAETAEKVCEYGPLGIRKYANFAKQFVDTALMLTYFGAACVYIVFISVSIRNVVEDRYPLGWDTRIYIAFVTIPLIFLGQVRKLKYLVPFSTVANVLIVVTFTITLYYMFNVKLEISDKPAFSTIQQLPLFFSTVIFAMEGIGAVMPVENSMRNPQHMLGCPGILNTAMITVISLYALIGFFGYVRYGDIVQGSITLNLAKGEILADVAKLLMAFAIFCTYGLQFFIPMEILWRKINHRISKDKHNMVEYILRTVIVIGTGVIAAAVPELEPFIGLMGAVFFSVLGLLIPTVIETIFRWPGQLGKFNWVLWKNMIFGLFAIFALITGAAVSISDIIKLYSGDNH